MSSDAVFSRAIIRPPGVDFSNGLTTSTLGPPILEKALEQHHNYCAALEACGLELVRLEADPRLPDSTFVEDTAVLAQRCAVVARPGAASRRGEIAEMRAVLARFYTKLSEISEPGTLDGGDVCQSGGHFFIGISGRTNEAGAEQLAGILAGEGFTASFVDMRGVRDILHLKSAAADLGDGRLLLAAPLAGHPAFSGRDIIRVPRGEEYAANCIRVNDRLLVAAGFPRLRRTLSDAGYRVAELDMSEFRKMDGGLSCLSLRF